MRPLVLDYQRGPDAFGGAARWLLLVSLAAVAATAAVAVSVDERMTELQTRVDRLERKRVPVVAKRMSDQDAKRYSEQIAFANGVAERLTLPWEDLLQAIEAGSAEGVALLSLEPDATKRLVRLTAEVKTRSDMLKYVQRLSADSRLRDVHLIEYQVLAQAPGSPVRFSVSAAWVSSAHA